MDISSLLSPPDELSPPNAVPSPRPRSSLTGSTSESPVASGSSSTPLRRSSTRRATDADLDADSDRADVVMGDSAAAEAVAPDSEVLAPAEPLTEDDYREIQTVLETIEKHPYQYSAHVQCIDLLRRAFLVAQGDRKPLLQGLRESREGMISIFPMVESMWLEWIEDEQSEAETYEERWKVMDLCTRAVTDQVASVKLFKAYGDFVEAQQVYAATDGQGAMSEEEFGTFKELFQREVVVDTYRQGAHATMSDIASSHLLWDKYRDLVIQDLAADPTVEKIELVYKMYRDRLRVPHATISDTFVAFSQFVTQYDNANYERNMVSFNKVYAASFAKTSEREIYEMPLKREVESSKTPGAEEWRIWSEYLEWETSRPRKKLEEKMASALYERCLLRFGEQAKVWEDYVFFLLEKGQNSMPKVISVLQRATRHCPWSGSLWAQHIVALEKGFKPFEEVSEVKHKATKTELLDLGGQEEVLKVNIAWCGFLKRRAFEHDSGEEDLDMAEMGINEAVTESENSKFQDPDYRLQRIQINFYTAAKKPDRARSIWQDLSKQKGSSYEFWLRYYYWELANGDKKDAGNVVRHALSARGLDWPEKILDTWRSHVEDFGSITDVESMMVKYRRVSIEIAEKREQDARVQAQQQPQSVTHELVERPQSEEQKSQGHAKRRRSEAGDESQPTSKKAKGEEEPAAPIVSVSHAPPTAQQVAKRDRENTTIIVRNLPPGYPEVKVRQYFRDCGTINSLKVIDEKDGSSATATVEFESKEDVLTAQTKNMKSVEGRVIQIEVGTGSTLYVTNFPPIADEAYIRNLFKDCGEIVDIRFPSLKYNTHRRFCYVQFSSAEGAHNATSLDGKQLGEKEHLVAKISAPSQKKDRSSATAEGREVYIRNIDFQAKEKDVRDLFAKFGAIEKVRLPPGPKKGTHKGFGFVVFESKSQAEAASLGANGTMLKSRALDVSVAQLNPQKFKPGNAVDSVQSMSSAIGFEDAINGGRNSPHPESTPPPSFEQIKKKTLGIMNLADTVNDTRLHTLFSPYGPLRKVTLRPDHQGAIVEYENVADAGKATLAMDGSDIDGLKVEIGELADLMKRQPDKKITKGFQKRPTSTLVPASVRNPAPRGGGGGQKRRAGLGFAGALSKKAVLDDVEMKNVEGGSEEKKGKSNEDFKKMFLSGN